VLASGTMDFRNGKYILPNLFTLGSILFGVLAIIACLEGTDVGFRRAAIAILAAVFADSLDGRVARLTRTATQFGVQLDSLADVVSFGVAPAVLAFSFGLHDLRAWDGMLGAALAFAFVSCGALRLARFNVMAMRTRSPQKTFVGLPIPAAASVLALFVWVAVDLELPERARVAGVAIAMPVLSFAMVSTLPYPSFKQVRWKVWNRLAFVVSLALIVWVALVTRASSVLFAIALAYFATGPVAFLARLARRPERQNAEDADAESSDEE